MNKEILLPDTIIDDVVDQFPEVIASFVQRRMHCVGCPMARFETIAEACQAYRLPLDTFIAELAGRINQPGASTASTSSPN